CLHGLAEMNPRQFMHVLRAMEVIKDLGCIGEGLFECLPNPIGPIGDHHDSYLVGWHELGSLQEILSEVLNIVSNLVPTHQIDDSLILPQQVHSKTFGLPPMTFSSFLLSTSFGTNWDMCSIDADNQDRQFSFL